MMHFASHSDSKFDCAVTRVTKSVMPLHQKLSMARVGTSILLFLVVRSGLQVLEWTMLAFELEHVSQLGKSGS